MIVIKGEYIVLINKNLKIVLVSILFLCLLIIQSCNCNDNNNDLILLKSGGTPIRCDSKQKNDVYKEYNINDGDVDTIITGYKTRDFLDVVFNRTSTRLFKDGPDIPDNDIELMLRTAMASPTAHDLRAWSFIIVRNRNIINEFINMCINQEHNGSSDIYKKAKLMVVVCGNPNAVIENDLLAESAKIYSQKKSFVDIDLGEYAYSVDTALASLNLLLAAEYLDYGAVWVDIFPWKERIEYIINKFNIPNNIVPTNVVFIGYPSVQKNPKNKFEPNKIYNEYWGENFLFNK